ncbi:MAG: 50S ribosomal protein L24 [Candidatus Magasanikbacteria bacterium]|nr:50S ribosomal protein L24 [Candidatus Magasanikbacteria bacterium]
MLLENRKIKTGDTVMVTAGKDKGKIGKILQVFPEKNRVVVEGANFMKKHIKARGGKGGETKGQILELSAPMHISNVMLVDPSTNKPTRVKLEMRDGKKVRVAKKSGTVI